jgi:hypothetical protein
MTTPTPPATSPPPPFSVLRPDVWPALHQRLDQVVSDDTVLGLVRDSVLRPLYLLDAMAADAPAALGDDFFAAERLRALLYLAAPWRALPAEAAQLAGKSPAAPYEPGVLHHGKLVIVGLAAVRVAPASAATELLATVHGLALALSAVEVLGRLEPAAPEPAALETMLRTLVGLGDVAGTPSAALLRPFALDRVERGRWACLAELFGGDALGSFVRERLQADGDGDPLWDGASVDAVASIEPAAAPAGGRLQLRGQFEPAAGRKGKDGDGPDVVFVAPDGALRAAEVVKRTKSVLTVAVPDGAETGWIGLSDPARIVRSNRYRKSVRDFWSSLSLPTVAPRPAKFLVCLTDAPVPTDTIRDIGRTGSGSARPLATPPRTASNRFTATVAAEASPPAALAAAAPEVALVPTLGPIVVSQSGKPPPLVQGQPFEVAVTYEPATLSPRLDLTATGGFEATATGAAGAATFLVPAEVARTGKLHLLVALTLPGARAPATRASAIVTVLAARIESITVTQDGEPPPFAPGRPLDVAVTYLPAVDLAVALHAGQATVEAQGTAGSATLKIPAGAVEAPELRMQVALFEPIARARVLDERVAGPFAVTAPALAISGVQATQGGASPPFRAGQAVDVVVTYTPDTVTGVVTIVLPGTTAAPLTAVTSAPGRATFQIPGASVVAGTLSFEARLRRADDRDAAVRARQTAGPFDVTAPAPVRVVLFRPTILRPRGAPRVTDEQRDALFTAASRSLGLDVSVQELPWVEDPLAIVASDVAGPEDPRVPLMFEAMSRAAAVTPGLEDALWIALVPTAAAPPAPPETIPVAINVDRPIEINVDRPIIFAVARLGFETHVPAEAALALGVCDVAGLPLLLRAASSLPTPRPSMPRLRVLGALDPGSGGVVLKTAREEERAAGAGASADLGLVAVALDGRGRELQRLPVKAVRQSDDASFELLFPVSPDVEAIQLRSAPTDACRGARARPPLAEIRRPSGQPGLSNFGLDASATPVLHWSYTHTNVARAVLQFELVDGPATLAFAGDPCRSHMEVPTQHLPPGRPLAVQLVATDGWNAAPSPAVSLAAQDTNLILRRVTGAEWWADSNAAGPFAWTLDGLALQPSDAASRTVRVDVAARGLLEVRLLDGETGDVLLADSRALGDGPNA